MILFLDFDGVLHPEPAATHHYLCRLPILEEILMDYPKVEIVISSTWRLDWTEESKQIDGMKAHFSLALRDRVVGVTPDHRQSSAALAPSGLGEYIREWECIDWLRAHRPADTPFLMLDDRPRLFRPNNPYLMTVDCDYGFLPDNEPEFRSRLASMEEQACGDSGESS